MLDTAAQAVTTLQVSAGRQFRLQRRPSCPLHRQHQSRRTSATFSLGTATSASLTLLVWRRRLRASAQQMTRPLWRPGRPWSASCWGWHSRLPCAALCRACWRSIGRTSGEGLRVGVKVCGSRVEGGDLLLYPYGVQAASLVQHRHHAHVQVDGCRLQRRGQGLRGCK